MQTLKSYANLDPDQLYYRYPNGSLTFYYVPNSGNLYVKPYPTNHQEMLEDDDDLFDDVYGDLEYTSKQRRDWSSRGQALKLTNCLLGRIGAVGEDFVISFWSKPPKNFLEDFLQKLFEEFPSFAKNKDKIIVVTPDKNAFTLTDSNKKITQDTVVALDTPQKKIFKIKNNLYSLQDLQHLRASIHTKDHLYDLAMDVLCSPDMDKYPDLKGYKPSNCSIPTKSGHPWRQAAVKHNIPYVYSYGETFRKFVETNMPIIDKIKHLIKVVEALPDTDYVSSDLFGPENKKLICLGFFNDVLNALPNPELEKRLSVFDLNDNYLEVYHKLNAPKSPVRNYLIAQHIK